MKYRTRPVTADENSTVNPDVVLAVTEAVTPAWGTSQNTA